jgi:hypothetical protein
MKTDYSISDANAVKQITDELFFKYTNDPYYLKKTLREIRSLVHQANLKADKLIEIDWFKDFNANEVLITLQKEFPNLSWNIKEDNPGYSFTSQLYQLHIEIKYIVNPSYNFYEIEEIKDYWLVDIYLNPPFYTLSNSASKLINLEVAIHYIKDTLLPIKKIFSNLQME